MSASEAPGRPAGALGAPKVSPAGSEPARFGHPDDQVAPAARGHAVTGWVVAWLLGVAAAASVLLDADLDVPDWVPLLGAGALAVLHTVALTHRTGGRTVTWAALVAALVVGGLVWSEPWTLSGVAVLVAVTSAVAAVLLTRPGQTAAASTLELFVALAIAAAGAVAVAAVEAPLEPQRFTLVVVMLALAVVIAEVWQLGPRLHGLGRRGLVLVIFAAAVLASLGVYAEILTVYGSEDVTGPLDQTVAWVADNLGGVPRPAEALIGFPALVCGIATRAHHRHGWWLCVFGALGTGAVTTTLADPSTGLQYAAVSLGYAAAIGLVLGLAVLRADRAMSGGSRGGRRVDRVAAVNRTRPEPGRTQPLR